MNGSPLHHPDMLIWLELPEKNTVCPVNFEFHINNENSISMFQAIFGPYLTLKIFAGYLKSKFNWVTSIFACWIWRPYSLYHCSVLCHGLCRSFYFILKSHLLQTSHAVLFAGGLHQALPEQLRSFLWPTASLLLTQLPGFPLRSSQCPLACPLLDTVCWLIRVECQMATKFVALDSAPAVPHSGVA